MLVDLHVAHGAAAARDRPRQELLRLRVEADEHVFRLVAGLDLPDGAVGGDVDRVGLGVGTAWRLELLHLPGLRIEVAQEAARVIAVPDRVVLADRDAARPRVLVRQRYSVMTSVFGSALAILFELNSSKNGTPFESGARRRAAS